MSCFCADDVNTNEGIGCCAWELLVDGLTLEDGTDPGLILLKEKRGGFAGPVAAAGLKEKFGVVPAAAVLKEKLVELPDG